MNIVEKRLTRIKGDAFVTATVRIEGERLSVTGVAGDVVRRAVAKKDALEYWRTFFEDQPEEIASMNERCGTRYRGALSAAKYVVNTDGEFHGLDVLEDRGSTVLVGHSFGQITEELDAFFPELKSIRKWHLNDMHAECEHQEARGETYLTHPDAVCPECGYKLGSAWLKRALPAEVIAAVNALVSE